MAGSGYPARTAPARSLHGGREYRLLRRDNSGKVGAIRVPVGEEPMWVLGNPVEGQQLVRHRLRALHPDESRCY